MVSGASRGIAQQRVVPGDLRVQLAEDRHLDAEQAAGPVEKGPGGDDRALASRSRARRPAR